MSLVKEFITSAKDLKMSDIKIVSDPDGKGLKASFPNIAIQLNSDSDETFEVVGFGVDGVSAVEDLSEKIQTAVNRGQLVKVDSALKPN